MTTISDLASHPHLHHHHHHSSNKITKAPRAKIVKPILKKLTSSPKNSLDLDRGWEDQSVDIGLGLASTPSSTFEPGRPSISRSIRDVSFQFPPWEAGGAMNGGSIGGGGTGSCSGSGTATPVERIGGGAAIGGALGSTSGFESSAGITIGVTTSRSMNRGRPGYHHARTASGTSHVSIATSGSSHRPGGSFVHPFQQTPRTNTPPLTYAHSFTSFERENNPARAYSPTIITENDDDDDDDLETPIGGAASLSQSLSTSSHLHRPQPSNSHSTASLRRPSLASQRTSSLSDIPQHCSSSSATTASTSATTANNSLRVNTNTSSTFPRSISSLSTRASRLAQGNLNSSTSNSDLQANHSSPCSDSPRPSIQLTSPNTSSTTTAMSPLRTSLEGAFRLRSRSEVDTGFYREDIREARRKFEENERIKQEKYESEQRRKQERRLEKEQHRQRKANTTNNNNNNGSEMSSIGRPSFSRKRSSPPPAAAVASSLHTRTRSGESVLGGGLSEKTTSRRDPHDGAPFLSSHYEATEGGAVPSFGSDVNDVRFETPKRSNTAKRRTQGYWTSFVLWFRTRLLKLGRR